MKIKVEIEQKKTVYGVRVNSDLNEGRGYQYTKCLCEKEATAIRLAKRADVQGTDGSVDKHEAYKINGKWFYPSVNVVKPNSEDYKAELILEEKRARDKAKKTALEKAKKLGLSDEEIELLK